MQELMSIVHAEEVLAGRRPANLDLEKTRRELFREFYMIENIDDIIKQLHEDELSRDSS
jgi:hypothetical protein